MRDKILLGYEVGTGNPVEIPAAHTVVCGQTQLSGKTTTLEAMVVRSGARALAFRTKRGERAFEEASYYSASLDRGFEQVTAVQTIPPYFRERADWRFVSSVLEATLSERMKFERSWIVRACKGARTLADVRKNLTKLETKAGGMSADIYMLLGEYLDIVIPVVARIPPTSGVELREGVNVVDLIGIPVEVQALVISSMMTWVHERERGVVCLLPESWKYIPQGRNSPVLMAARSLAREGAGIKNLVWIDSQDLAGVEKEIVRACSVYILGVQREMNEVKRTLSHIPAGIKKPKADEIATLKRGEFFACFGDRTVRTYVCPAWLSPARAQLAASAPVFTPVPAPLGDAVAEKRPIEWKTVDLADPLPIANEEEETMSKATDERLDKLTSVLERVAEHLAHPVMTTVVAPSIKSLDEIAEGAERAHAQQHEREDKPGKAAPASRSTKIYPSDESPTQGRAGFDAVYEAILARLKEEAPAVIKAMATRPELLVTIEKREVEYVKDSMKGKIAVLYARGFFKEAKAASEVAKEVNRQFGEIIAARTWDALNGMVSDGLFYLDGKSFVGVVGVKATVTG